MSLAALAVAAVLFVAVNIIGDSMFRSARLDLTENGLYTLSPGTRSVLGAIDEPITLRFFFSAKLAEGVPQIRVYGKRVRDMLEEYVNLSQGRIRLEVIDPESFSDAEDRALGYGLQGATVNATGDSLYFGLVGTNSADDSQVIPFFSSDKEQFLEYDLTKLVYGLNIAKKPVVGMISELPLEYGPGGLQMAMRGQSRPYAVYTAMRQFFDVRTLDRDLKEIDEDIDVLLLVQPKDLDEATLYAIDQFVLRGGRAMVFVDPFSETAATMPMQAGMPPNPGASQSSNLPRLFSAWGIEMADDRVIGDRKYATRVGAGGRSTRPVVDFIPWLSMAGEALNREDVVTGDLGTVLAPTPGRLRALEGATTTFTPLLRSSEDAMLIEAERVRLVIDPDDLLKDFAPAGERFVVAARLSGPVKSAFDGPPPQADEKAAATESGGDEAAARPYLSEASEPINVIVVADSDLLDDRFWLQRQNLFGQEVVIPTASNGDFLVNGLDNLAGSGELISLRSRARSDRPFAVIEGLRRQAEQRYLAREQALRGKLGEIEKELVDLQSKASGSGGEILSREEAQAIENFREALVTTRKELRDVRHELRKDIANLENRIKLINIALVPFAVFAAALLVAAWRYRRRNLPARPSAA